VGVAANTLLVVLVLSLSWTMPLTLVVAERTVSAGVVVAVATVRAAVELETVVTVPVVGVVHVRPVAVGAIGCQHLAVSADCALCERGSCAGSDKIAFGVAGEVGAATCYGKGAAGYVGRVAAFSADLFNCKLYRSCSNLPGRGKTNL
jgi:hypothetical protein